MSDKDPAQRTPRVPPEPGSAPDDSEHLRRLQRERRARVAKAIAILGIVVLLIVFVIRNSGRVLVDFVFFTREARLIWILLVTTVLGGIAGYLLGRPSKRVRLHDDPKKDEEKK